MVIAHVTLLTAFLAAAPAHAQGNPPAPACESQFSGAGSTVGSLTLPNGRPFDLDRALWLFRFNRPHDALREIDSALKHLQGPWRWRVPDQERKELKTELTALRRCIANTKPPAMATVTVDTFLLDPAAPERGGAPVAGAEVNVEGRPVGRTRDDGTLTVSVPSGAIRVTAELAPTTWGEGYITLPPGGSERLTIQMDDEKEVGDDTDLVLAEAVDDIIPVASPSFTLKFVRGNKPAPIVRLGYIDLVDRHENMERNLNELFTVANGAITATSTAAVFESLAAHFGGTITLHVYAEDAAGGTHDARVRFRVGQSRLFVTLSPPPSNPALPVANIEVGVSIVGSGIAVQGVSDAEGRFEIEALPHGTIALDCETVSNGLYYYCGATLANWGEQSVILVLRHVTDIVRGVPPLTLQPNTAAAPHVERKPKGDR